jgi:hypothetical protein
LPGLRQLSPGGEKQTRHVSVHLGWLFTIAFAKLIWWQALLGLLIWPYYLGLAAR